MTSFDTAVASGLPDFFHEFGQSATINLINGLPVSAENVIKAPETTRTDEGQGVSQVVRLCSITIAASDVSDPYSITTITIGGEDWTFSRVEEQTGAYSIVEMQIVRREVG